MRDLADLHYAKQMSSGVLDNLPPTPPARWPKKRIGWKRLEWKPKHASWLNMVEIEIGVLVVSRAIGSKPR